jgi:hypothetical protein
MHHPVERRGDDRLSITPAVARDRAPEAGSFLRRLFQNLASPDYVIGAYFALMLLAVVSAKGPGAEESVRTVAVDIACFTVGILLTRGGILKHGSFANGIVYRLTLFCAVFLSYFQLRSILPAVSPHSLDAEILAFDLRVFGFEPSVSWDQYVNPHTTEWFAFFYFGYFFLLIAHVIPIMLVAKSRFRIAHFAVGIFILFCAGHLLYMVVPGWGPYHHLAGQFEHPLEGGLFWRLVKATVEAGGSQKDIFPSLHTATPTYFAIYSFIHRRAFPFRFTWPFMAFVATQIIGATMFLRWHYLIDIFAGLTLATTAALLSHRIVTWDTARRARKGLLPIFIPLDWRGISGRRAGDGSAENLDAHDGDDSGDGREEAAQ